MEVLTKLKRDRVYSKQYHQEHREQCIQSMRRCQRNLIKAGKCVNCGAVLTVEESYRCMACRFVHNNPGIMAASRGGYNEVNN